MNCKPIQSKNIPKHTRVKKEAKKQKINDTLEELITGSGIITHKKKLLCLDAMVATLGNITKTCKIINIERRTFYDWLENDPDFRAAIHNLEDQYLDSVEEKLQQLIDMKNTAAILFFLKCKGKNRGWTERTENIVTTTNIEPIQIQIVNPNNQQKQDNNK